MNSIRHLELIQALAEHGSFTRAADALGMSQPALTRGLRHVEETIGAELFTRSSPVRPTIFGEIVLRRSEQVLREFSEIRREIALTQKIELGTVTVSAAHYPAAISVQPGVAAFSTEHPLIQCSLLLRDWTEVLDDVRSGASDFGVAYLREVESDTELATETLREDELVFFCRQGHPLARNILIERDDLFDYPWVGPALPNEMAPNLPDAPRIFASHDPKRRRLVPRIHVENFAAMKAIVLESDCITGAPLVLIQEDIAAGRLHAFELNPGLLNVRYGFILNPNRPLSPAAGRLMDIIRRIESAKSASKGTRANNA